MRLFGTKKESGGSLSREDALGCRPIKNPEVIETRLDSGVVLLRYPMRIRPWIKALACRLGAGDPAPALRKLQLDILGTEVWNLMDGSRTVGDVIQVFARQYHLPYREAEMSVTLFIRHLGRRGLIGLARS